MTDETEVMNEVDQSATPAPEVKTQGDAEIANEVKDDQATEAKEIKAEDAASDPAVEEKPKKQVDPRQKKIAELAYKNRELERRIEQVLNIAEKSAVGTKEAEPKLEDFATFEEYLDKRDEYREKKRETVKEPVNNYADDLNFKINSLHESGSEKYDDFKESVAALKITDPMRDAVLSYEDAETQAEIAYYLSKNQKEADKIAALSPLRQIAEIGKIEAKLSAPPPTKRPSKAPDPINPVGGKETRTDPLASAKTDEEWIRARDKQERDAYLARKGKG